MKNYFHNCWQGRKINTTFSSWSALLKGIMQGSAHAPVCSVYFKTTCNFADNTRPHACDIKTCFHCMSHSYFVSVQNMNLH